MASIKDAKTSPVLQQLTAAEMSIAERKSKLSIATLEDPNYPKIDILGALGWVWAKRSDVKLTFEDYMNSHTLDQITKDLGIEDDEDDDGLPGDEDSEAGKDEPTPS